MMRERGMHLDRNFPKEMEKVANELGIDQGEFKVYMRAMVDEVVEEAFTSTKPSEPMGSQE
jgi:hypothetical protein